MLASYCFLDAWPSGIGAELGGAKGGLVQIRLTLLGLRAREVRELSV